MCVRVRVRVRVSVGTRSVWLTLRHRAVRPRQQQQNVLPQINSKCPARCPTVPYITLSTPAGAPINESDHCGDPPLILAAGNGEE